MCGMRVQMWRVLWLGFGMAASGTFLVGEVLAQGPGRALTPSQSSGFRPNMPPPPAVPQFPRPSMNPSNSLTPAPFPIVSLANGGATPFPGGVGGSFGSGLGGAGSSYGGFGFPGG